MGRKESNQTNKQTVGLPYRTYFYFFLDIKKKSSENDQFIGHFQSFFIYLFRPTTQNLKKKNRKSTYNWVHRQGSDQTERMPMLIWVFPTYTLI